MPLAFIAGSGLTLLCRGQNVAPTVRKPLGYMALETTFHHHHVPGYVIATGKPLENQAQPCALLSSQLQEGQEMQRSGLGCDGDHQKLLRRGDGNGFVVFSRPCVRLV